ncbi:hypothetical protein GQ602_005570 [Ophiocordyceps camponoti-floridani]|uniref:DNA-directed RNA polymerase III subunit n=1 Tax=Ophiocordyceps camponoti-floridani TaxID=2030778 RepID=A0A8H4Q3K6_9HYPO|nr:hypothetical protein GQ602_005570 [Ophiocordyceps camponoti-floridani]
MKFSSLIAILTSSHHAQHRRPHTCPEADAADAEAVEEEEEALDPKSPGIQATSPTPDPQSSSPIPNRNDAQPRVIPTPRRLTAREVSAVDHFLVLRRQFHESPLYASRRTSLHDPTAPRKLYGQAQMNANYDVRDKASLDPFTAVPAYSHKFVPRDRPLPNWSARPVCSELFPPELRSTVEPDQGSGLRKRPRLELSRVNALPSAEEAFGIAGGGEGAKRSDLLDKLNALPENEDDDEVGEMEEDEQLHEDDGDEVYDDEDAGDYDAENYFDNGDDMADDYGDGDDGEGTY